MTRLVTTGWETGDITESGSTQLAANGTQSVVTSSPSPRSGNYSLRCGPPSATGTNGSTKMWVLPSSRTDLWLRFGVYLHAGNAPSQMIVGGAWDSNSFQPVTCINWDPSTQLFVARQNVSISGTVLATSGTVCTADTWHVIDWRIQLTSTSAGIVELWQDGVQVINFSGDVTPSATANVAMVQLGCQNAMAATGPSWYVAIDDVAINDTNGTSNAGRARDGRVILLRPNGAGSSTVLTRGGTDTGANYSQVSEVPPSMTQYVGSSIVGDRDLYTLQDLSASVQSINVVEMLVLAQNSDVGGGWLALTLKSGGTTTEATPVGLSTTSAYVSGRWETDPDTGSAWTLSAVNALEGGGTVR